MHDEIVERANWGRTLRRSCPGVPVRARSTSGRHVGTRATRSRSSGLPATLARRVARRRSSAGEPDHAVRDRDPDRLLTSAAARALARDARAHARRSRTPAAGELVAPVRPTLKHRYPLTPIEQLRRVAARGRPATSTRRLRAHERLGAEVARGIAPDSLRHRIGDGGRARGMVRARVSRRAASYVVAGRSSRSRSVRGRDHGTYREPNVWLRHPGP